jgi:PAS domain S-box-containing protein
VEVSARAINLNGKPYQLRLIRNLTERQETQNELRGSEATLRAFFDATNVLLAVLEMRGLEVAVTRPNASMAQFFRTEIGAMSGRSAREAGIPEEFSRMLCSKAQDCLRQRTAQAFECEVDGGMQTRWLHCSLSLAGESSLAFAAVDTTDRKAGERALQESQQRLARAQTIASMGSWEVEEPDLGPYPGAHDVYRWSDEVFRIFGVDPATFVPTRESFYSFVHPEDRQKVQAAVQDALRNQRSYDVEHRIIRQGGTVRHVVEHAEFEYAPDGRPLRLSGTIQDVTEYRELEEQFRQAQKLESVGKLAGGIAHDFNNLLTVIKGYCDIVLRNLDTSDPLREPLEEIARAGARAEALTQQLLAFSRKQMRRVERIDLNHVVKDGARLLGRLIGEDVRLETELHSHELTVCADVGQLHQVLMNLAVNARDAMPKGGTLLIQTAERHITDEDAARFPELAVPGQFAWLCVSDTGHGMPDEVRRRAFDPFFTTKPPGAGTGLGLSTVYGIVKQSGGAVHLSSEAGGGTSVEVLLPLDQGSQTAPAVPPSPCEASSTDLS